MIRTSKFTTKFTNKNKLNNLTQFVENYQQIVQDWIDALWNQLDLTTYEMPKFLSTKYYSKGETSQRIIKCAATQASSIVRSQTEKLRKLIWIVNQLKKENQDITQLEEKLAKIKITKPILSDNFKCEVNSICADLLQRNGFCFLQLKSLGNLPKIRIPIKLHKQFNKWKYKGKLLNSFLISKKSIEIRIQIESKNKAEGKTLGADQGITTCLTLSDGQVTKADNHHWDLSKILDKLSKKKKGSKAFARAQEHRKNYINWSINQLNLVEVKTLKLEEIKDIRRGKSTDRKRSHWTYTLIRDKLKRFCEENKVCFVEQSCAYRSQRCSSCGLVKKSNRQGKVYRCQCGYVDDADLNASLNHELDLPSVEDFVHSKHNINGFYWLEAGVFDLDGEELTVSHANKTQSIE